MGYRGIGSKLGPKVHRHVQQWEARQQTCGRRKVKKNSYTRSDETNEKDVRNTMERESGNGSAQSLGDCMCRWGAQPGSGYIDTVMRGHTCGMGGLRLQFTPRPPPAHARNPKPREGAPNGWADGVVVWQLIRHINLSRLPFCFNLYYIRSLESWMNQCKFLTIPILPTVYRFTAIGKGH